VKRVFTVDGEEWLAWASGGGAYGTGNRGLGNVIAVHFARSSAPDVPVLEALLAAGRFDDLFDTEIIQLFGSARTIVDAASVPARPMGRRTLSG
jgi:hypothetical protein